MRLWFLLLVSLNCFAEIVPVSYDSRDFHFSDNESEIFTLHVTRPSLEYGQREGEGHSWLKKVRAFVWGDAETKGYLNAQTTPHYERELTLLEQGRWPTVFITRKGSDEILLNLSFAIRWADEPLPFEARFFGRGIEGLPDAAPFTEDVAYAERGLNWHEFTELYYPENLIRTRSWIMLRPIIFGEKTEIKFLTSSDPRPLRFIQVIHEASIDYELHRYSQRRVSEGAWKIYDTWVREHGRYGPTAPAPFLAPGRRSEEAQAMADYFHRRMFDRSWQPYIVNTRLYAHVSGPRIGDSDETILKKAFIFRMGFPEESRWGFEETIEFGTPGIYTDIFDLSMHRYERQMEEHFAKLAGGALQDRVTYLPRTHGPCRGILSTAESGMLDYVTKQN